MAMIKTDGAGLSCFKAYDIRGRVPDELDGPLAYNIGRAYAEVVRPGAVVVGRDIRKSGEMITGELIRGLTDAGTDVLDIGLCGTEQIYFSTFHLQDKGVGGGIIVTASHNPADYNGMKFVREGARPISGDTGLKDIEKLAMAGKFGPDASKGKVERLDTSRAYIDHLLGYIEASKLPRYRVVMDAGNGCAGPVADVLAARLPVDIVRLHFDPDGEFPNGVPNPLLPENRVASAKSVVDSVADIGVAWDGDFDRCFFFDEKGEFIEGYYIVGLLARAILSHKPGAKIIHDPRLTWNTVEVVKDAGGVPVMSKTGHAFIKERMRAEDAVYGGEMSAHHYFREFAYCDSGMIPWLLVLELMGKTGRKLSELVAEMSARYPISGEINRTIADPKAALMMV
ncbi:MAG TPA: phosphomannomutase, partial [Nitrospirota bacterium]